MATWTLDAYNRVGTVLVQADLPFKALTASYGLNSGGTLEAEFSLNASGLTNVLVGQHELQLKRNGTVVWAGPLMQTDVDPDGHRVRFLAEGLLSWFASRIITSDLYYSAVNQQTIAWNLIDHTQGQANGSLGITLGAHTGSNVTRTRAYCGIYERPNVLEELFKFTEPDDGLDFEIDPAARTFKTWQGRRGSASGIALTGSSVDSLTYTESARELVTYADAIGEGDCKPNVQTYTAPGSEPTTYGRRHVVEDVDHTITADILGVAKELVNAGKRPRFDATVTFREGGTGAPAWGAWGVGDTLTLQDSRGYSTFGPKTLRVVDWTVNLDQGLPNVPVFELALSSAVGA